MKIYLAPMEGVTNNIFRDSLCRHFGGVDKYFTPFITPASKLSTKIKRDISPDNNIGQRLVPQILTNDAEGFLELCRLLSEYGYDEFNLNLGCPSGTVVSKGRGSGFLAYTDELNRFLERIYSSSYKISVKTRIGKDSPEEFYRLMEIYNSYPITELIIHPRTRQDMYKGEPYWDMFEYAQKNSTMPLCYNGDIFTVEDYNRLTEHFPNLKAIMLGRGLVANPALALMIKGEGELDINRLRAFYKDIYDGYKQILSGDTQLMFKLKEILLYMTSSFKDNEKITKNIRKAKKLEQLNIAVEELMSCELVY